MLFRYLKMSWIYRYGDILLLAIALDGRDDELAEIKQALEAYAVGRPLAAEVVPSNVEEAEMLAVMKRLGVDIAEEPRLVLQFWSHTEGEAGAQAATVCATGDRGLRYGGWWHRVDLRNCAAQAAGRAGCSLQGAGVKTLDSAQVLSGHGSFCLAAQTKRRARRASRH